MSSERWWQDSNWKKDYARQIALAHGLLKLFSPESIINALNSKEGSWIYSLSYKGLVEIIKNHEVKDRVVDVEEHIEFEEIAVKEVAQIKLNKKSAIDKLMEME